MGSFAEWSKALRHMGFEGDIKETFRQQDYNNSGIVTFAEFDPEMAAKMKEFKLKVLNHFLQRESHNDEDWNEVWVMLDVNGNNKLESDEFAEICATIGYEGDPIEMFRQLRSHPSRKYLHLEGDNAGRKSDDKGTGRSRSGGARSRSGGKSPRKGNDRKARSASAASGSARSSSGGEGDTEEEKLRRLWKKI